jgi:hypothetical protein
MNKSGQATLEFASAVVLVFIFLFALIDFGMMFYVNLTMENAVREGGRHVVTGQGNNLRKALVDTIRSYSAGLYDKNASPDAKDGPSVYVRDIRSFANYSGVPVLDTTGSAGQVIMVSLAAPGKHYRR